MFRVEIFVDDRKLAECLRNLIGVAVDHPKVEPVVGAEVRRGKIKVAEKSLTRSEAEGSNMLPPLPERVYRLICATQSDDITTSTIARFVAEAGGNSTSTAYVRHTLCKQKLLIPVKGQQGVMTINRKEI